jgi:hypothetical protein
VAVLDQRVDSSVLDDEGWALGYYLEDQRIQLDAVEEEYWKQRIRL